MGKSCCEAKSEELKNLRLKQGSVLKWVLAINAIMFVVELTFGILSRSASLMADSLDMFGDAAVYAFSLFALNRGGLWRARAGLSKGLVMAVFGILVLGRAGYSLFTGAVPVAETMGIIGFVALTANATCLYLLFRHRGDDINMRSTWLCSRNDIAANVGVLAASAAVAYTASGLPDIIVGTLIGSLFLTSAWSVIRESRSEISTFTPSLDLELRKNA